MNNVYHHPILPHFTGHEHSRKRGNARSTVLTFYSVGMVPGYAYMVKTIFFFYQGIIYSNFMFKFVLAGSQMVITVLL